MISQFIGLPNLGLFIGHYFKRTSATLLADSKAVLFVCLLRDIAPVSIQYSSGKLI